MIHEFFVVFWESRIRKRKFPDFCHMWHTRNGKTEQLSALLSISVKILQIYDKITWLLTGAPHPRTSVKKALQKAHRRRGAHNENKARTTTKWRSSARLHRAPGNTELKGNQGCLTIFTRICDACDARVSVLHGVCVCRVTVLYVTCIYVLFQGSVCAS